MVPPLSMGSVVRLDSQCSTVALIYSDVRSQFGHIDIPQNGRPVPLVRVRCPAAPLPADFILFHQCEFLAQN